ncbi:hypothetical protein JRQ81_014972 [Phrynocephalus forsythii]|uniref:Transmembrane protein 69 n=1 Tax=Phrynocephalus forsythii TaxID=171643 RepID=A0A9Q1B3B9_9SAUR|nr:hypothetical protein JRQ81_014972 [Phrynocephalus forsythii]
MFQLLRPCFRIPSKVVYHPRLLHMGRCGIAHPFSFGLPTLQLLRQTPVIIIKTQDIHSSACTWKKKKSPDPEQDIVGMERSNPLSLKDCPKPALYLGFAGLIPFVSVPLIMAVSQVAYSELVYAQVAYGVSILAFLGGIRWGFALPEGSPDKPNWTSLSISIVPPLMSWFALLCRNNIEAAAMVIVGLGIALHYDIAFLPTYPTWFRNLRTVLTMVTAGSLFVTIFIVNVCPEKHLSDIISEKISKLT